MSFSTFYFTFFIILIIQTKFGYGNDDYEEDEEESKASRKQIGVPQQPAISGGGINSGLLQTQGLNIKGLTPPLNGALSQEEEIERSFGGKKKKNKPKVPKSRIWLNRGVSIGTFNTQGMRYKPESSQDQINQNGTGTNIGAINVAELKLAG